MLASPICNRERKYDWRTDLNLEGCSVSIQQPLSALSEKINLKTKSEVKNKKGISELCVKTGQLSRCTKSPIVFWAHKLNVDWFKMSNSPWEIRSQHATEQQSPKLKICMSKIMKYVENLLVIGSGELWSNSTYAKTVQVMYQDAAISVVWHWFLFQSSALLG